MHKTGSPPTEPTQGDQRTTAKSEPDSETKAVSEQEYENIKRAVDSYIGTIRANEQNQTLKDKSIAELEQFMEGFHTSTWRLKNLFYAVMENATGSGADARLQRIWSRYKDNSRFLEDQRQQQLSLVNRGRSEVPAQRSRPIHYASSSASASAIQPEPAGSSSHRSSGHVYTDSPEPGRASVNSRAASSLIFHMDSDSSRHGSAQSHPQQSRRGSYETGPYFTSQNNAPLSAQGLAAPNAGHPQGPGGGPHLVPGSGFSGLPTPGFTGPYGPVHGQAATAYPAAYVHPEAGPGYHNNPQAVYPTNPSSPTGPGHQGSPPDAAYQYPTSSPYQHPGGARYQYYGN